MTPRLSAICAAILVAAPAFAGGFTFDLPQLAFPEPSAPVTQSTSGAVMPALVIIRN